MLAIQSVETCHPACGDRKLPKKMQFFLDNEKLRKRRLNIDQASGEGGGGGEVREVGRGRGSSQGNQSLAPLPITLFSL